MMLVEWEDGEIVKSWKAERARRERLDRMAWLSFLFAAAAIVTAILFVVMPGRAWP